MNRSVIPVKTLVNMKNKFMRWNWMFLAFSKVGDKKSDGTITLPQSDKWMKQANVIDNYQISPSDTAVSFNKLKKTSLTMAAYNQFLDDLAKSKNIPIDDIKSKMLSCGLPGSYKVALVKIINKDPQRYIVPSNDDVDVTEQPKQSKLHQQKELSESDENHGQANSWADFRSKSVLENIRKNLPIPKK